MVSIRSTGAVFSSVKSPRVHASVRGQREGCHQDAGSVQFRCVHLIGVLGKAGISPDHDIIGTTSLGDLEDLRPGR